MKFYLQSTASSVLYGNDEGFLNLYKDLLKDFNVTKFIEHIQNQEYISCILETDNLEDLLSIQKLIKAFSFTIFVKTYDELCFIVNYDDGDPDELEDVVINAFKNCGK